jgi:serine/threonine protein kinase/tetratricopeptide (TPR) repeat protein
MPDFDPVATRVETASPKNSARFLEFGRHVETAIDLTCTSNGAPPMRIEESRAEVSTDSAYQDTTLTYSVGRTDEHVRPWIGADQQEELCNAFVPGRLVQGRYQIDRELGRGGMGVVLLARDLRLDRPVAIKVSLLLARTDDRNAARLAELRGAFSQEARLGANLNHPAIATVFDYGFHDEKPFTVFEYLPGETLRDLLRRRERLPLEDVRLIIGPIAQALDFAHARRVVHRDLKPDNIRATEQGLFKVLDLGLAREFGRDVEWSGFAGTPAYAAPEQAAGQPCDGRADQYALALIAYELLTGHRLFQSSDPHELLAMHREAEPVGLAADLADAPPAARRALISSLSKDPNARFASCGDFAASLGCQLLSIPVPAAEILREADVEQLSIGRRAQWVSFPWLQDSVHLALTREAVWSTYHTAVRRWPLAALERVDPQTSSESDRAEDETAEIVRRTHRAAETRVGLLSRLHFVASAALMIFVTCLVVITVFVAVRPRPWLTAIVLGVPSVLSLWLFVVGRALRNFRPWARLAALANSAVFVALAVTFLIMGSITQPPVGLGRTDWVSAVGASLAVLFSLFAYVAWILLSRQTAETFTPSYQKIIDQTRYLDPRKALSSGLADRATRRTLRLTFGTLHGRAVRVAFRFSAHAECDRWAGQLGAMIARPADDTSVVDSTADIEPSTVVLLQQRPNARYQLLGPVEATGEKRRFAEASLQIRAAIMGADALIDLHEEHLPDLGQSVRRLTGIAVRAVDAESQFEFRTRWYADQIARVTTWALIFLLANLPLMMLGGVLLNVIERARLELMVPTGRGTPTGIVVPDDLAVDLLWKTLTVASIALAVLAWPLALAVLLRWLRWPQLVLPLALTLVAFALRPVGLLGGLIAAAIASGGWAGMLYHGLWLVDPLSILILVFSLFLARTAWRADREFRSLVPESARRTSRFRTGGARAAWVASVVYTVSLAGVLVSNGYSGAANFRLPTAINRKAATASADSRAGAALLTSDVARAEAYFQRALPLWEELVRSAPAEFNYSINLESTRTNMAIAKFAQGRMAEATEPLARCVARWETLVSGPLTKTQRAIVDQSLDIARSTLVSINVTLELKKGHALWTANDKTGAEAAYRRALQAVVTSPAAPSRNPLLQSTRNRNDAGARNAIAWVLVAVPGSSPAQLHEAVTLAEKATSLDPTSWSLWNTLALARYRLNDWNGAIAALDRSQSLPGGDDPSNGLILAMIRWRLGETTQAQRLYDDATNQIKRQHNPPVDLERLRDEADALLKTAPSH